MAYSRDAFATMLLTMALVPNREEYARPYSAQEFSQLERRARESGLAGVGELVGVDISGLMIELDIPEEEAYRIYTLLSRSVQLSYLMERFFEAGMEIVTLHSDGYPARLARRLGDAAPPFLYRCGNAALLGGPAVAVLGNSGVKTSQELRAGIERLAREAAAHGYAVVTGGELGVSRVAANAVAACGGSLVDVLGGGLMEHLTEAPFAQLLSEGRMAVASMEHPEAMLTVTHAIARNRAIFALSDAAFICNTDNRRGETEALRSRYCDWIYAWTGYPANATLISRGATPVADLTAFDFEGASRNWRRSQSEQMSIFDLLGE